MRDTGPPNIIGLTIIFLIRNEPDNKGLYASGAF